jgi:hypothetical protein
MIRYVFFHCFDVLTIMLQCRKSFLKKEKNMERVGVSKLLTGTVHRRLVELCGHSGSSSGAHSPAVVAPDLSSLQDKSFQKLALTDPAENIFGIVSGLCS